MKLDRRLELAERKNDDAFLDGGVEMLVYHGILAWQFVFTMFSMGLL